VNREWQWPLGAAAFVAILYLASQLPLPETWWLVPWILSLVLIGLPHGALDHEVILRLWRPQPPPRWALAAGIAGYLFLAALVMAAWFAAPLTIFACFILLTWAHWGLGDLWWSWQRDPAYFTSSFHRAVFALWRGALPMLLPLVVDPQIYRQIAESISRLFSDSPANLGWFNAISFRAILLGCLLVVGFLEASLANRRSGTYLINASESFLLVVAFICLPPLVSIGFYFVFWHGLRHVLRLMRMEHLSFWRFARRSAPATVSALILLVILTCAVLRRGHHPSFLAAYLALIAALTVPHSVVVAWMDRRARLY
jgi:Brp/Blh family beta-carotene 15,15'-monooxygenase